MQNPIVAQVKSRDVTEGGGSHFKFNPISASHASEALTHLGGTIGGQHTHAIVHESQAPTKALIRNIHKENFSR